MNAEQRIKEFRLAVKRQGEFVYLVDPNTDVKLFVFSLAGASDLQLELNKVLNETAYTKLLENV